jgi:hypothetical protein
VSQLFVLISGPVGDLMRRVLSRRLAMLIERLPNQLL